MKIDRLEIRFFKSFNFDYERKWSNKSEPAFWEDTTEGWYPFVRVKIDPSITAVVGANEAGKTQLLDALEIALTGRGIDEGDFCRYSTFYSVEKGRVRAPEFGVALRIENENELAVLQAIVPQATSDQQFTLYRPGRHPSFIILNGGAEVFELSASQLAALDNVLPPVFRLRTDLGMPDALSIDALADGTRHAFDSRRRRSAVFGALRGGAWSAADEFAAHVFPVWQSHIASPDTEAEARRNSEFELGRKLLVDIAGIDPASFARLRAAIANEQEGEIEGLVRAMNIAIAENLNFKRWWSQDTDFELEVKAREHELALVIRDRTRASYSFDERSQGLRFFLSYFVQLTAHRRGLVGPEVMLLDEPDAYLSSRGQQDLLRVISDYATPEDGSHKHQVVYVTHSPFLIDRNAGHRLRVLDKGAEDEGTRVVKDATQNHYEPLRTSLGATVAETAFIGGSNLFVEGLADQVMLAGASAYFRRTNDDHDYLDLNDLTIVPSGSAESIPYMVFLARGRDQVKPACVGLFDGDKAGKAAAKTMRERLVHRRAIIPEECIVELDVWAQARSPLVHEAVVLREIEDLVHPEFATSAARAHAKMIEGFDDEAVSALTADAVVAAVAAKDGSLWDGLDVAYRKAFKGAHIEKVGFARAVVELFEGALASSTRIPGQDETELAMRALLRDLSDRLASASAEETQRRSDRRLSGKVREFQRDHQDSISKRRARSLLREIDLILDSSADADHVRVELEAIRRDFDLDERISELVPRFEGFQARVSGLSLQQRIRDQGLAAGSVAGRGESD
jgi:predicted ATPase